MQADGSEKEGKAPSLKLTIVPSEEMDDYDDEYAGNAHSTPYHLPKPIPFTISTPMETSGAHEPHTPGATASSWESPRPHSARSEPGYSTLRSFTTSPVNYLASGLADIQPIGGDTNSGPYQPSSPLPFSLMMASPSSSQSPLASRASPRYTSASSRIMSSPRASLRASPSQSFPDQIRASPLGDSSSSLLSTSASSDEYGSMATDTSNERVSFDSQRFSEELPRPSFANQHALSSSSYSLDTRRVRTHGQLPTSPRYGDLAIPPSSSSPHFGYSRTTELDSFGAPAKSNSDEITVRSRSRTLHSIDRSYAVSATSPTNPDRLSISELHLQADVSSPTRSRGGNPNQTSQRSANFLNNPRPSITRQRRESTTSRPKPKFADGSAFPKEIPVSGLIPELKTVVPASPSRPQCKLPYFHRKNDVTCNRISSQTLMQLMTGQYSHIVSEFYVIDCRSEKEFAGGHIKDSIHAPTWEVAVERFITSRLDELRVAPPNIALIFSCEFSESRSPSSMRRFRDVDRTHNTWPAMFYHDVYCLDGGYSKFYEKYIQFCEPQGYTPEPQEHHHRNKHPLRRSVSAGRFHLSQSMGYLPSMEPRGEDDADLQAASSSALQRLSASSWQLPFFPNEEEEDKFASEEQ